MEKMNPREKKERRRRKRNDPYFSLEFHREIQF